jgi:hypothetical protein
MKLYYFNPNDYGTEYYVLAENKINAITYLLNHFKQTKNMEKFKMWKNTNSKNPQTFPINYTLEEHGIGDVLVSSIS